MAFVLANRVRESSLTVGTIPLVLSGPPIGFRPWASVLNVGDTSYYTASDPVTGDYEVGSCTLLTGNAISRGVIDSSNGGALVAFLPGTRDVFMDIPASVLLPLLSSTAAASIRVATTSPVLFGTNDNIVVVQRTAPAATSVVLPAAPYTGQEITVVDGSGDANVNPITLSGGTINLQSSYVISVANQAVTLAYDGSGWRII